MTYTHTIYGEQGEAIARASFGFTCLSPCLTFQNYLEKVASLFDVVNKVKSQQLQL